MRFAFVFDGLGCGGIERVGIQYCNSLADRGHDVTVVNLVPSVNEFVSRLSDKITYTTSSLPRRLSPERYCSLISRAAWGRFVYPLLYSVCSVAIAVKSAITRKQFSHFDVAIAFSGHFNDLTFVSSGCVKAKKKLAWIHGSVNSYALISDGYINLYKHFDLLVCLSDEGLEEFKDAKHWLNFPLVKLYNPINLYPPEEDRQKINELQKAYGDYILMVARLASPKDPKTLVDAVAILREEYGIERNCLIVGDGPDMNDLGEYVVNSSVADLVHLIGYDSNPLPYFRACRVFVLSSLNEGLPTVLLEAMALGKPVVSTNVSGAREILEGGKDGILCGIKDAEDMARNIAKLFDSELIYQHYAESALRRIEDFSADKAIDGLLGHIEDLVR